MEQADALRIALKKLGEVYQSAYGYEIGAYDELYIDASSISYFLQLNGVDVRALEAEADVELENEWSEDADDLSECPRCHTEDCNDTSIKDHGMCYACHKMWQNGELDDEADPIENLYSDSDDPREI